MTKKLTGETREEYLKEEQKYFQNTEANPTRDKMSASDLAIAEKHLPSKEDRARITDRFERGFDKTQRSGAQSKPGSGPAIFPQGKKFAMDFIDEMTPGKYKPEADPTPPTEQKGPVGGKVPKAVAAIQGICIDCMKEIDLKRKQRFVPSLFIIMEQDALKCYAMGVQFGDCVFAFEHFHCWKQAQEKSSNPTPLVLIKDGKLTSEEDIKLAMRYGFPIGMHDGVETTIGQWETVKRKDRLEQQLHDFLKHADKDSDIYTVNREKRLANG